MARGLDIEPGTRGSGDLMASIGSPSADQFALPPIAPQALNAADHTLVSPEAFSRDLNGYEQEAAIKDQMRAGNRAWIEDRRRDFSRGGLTPEQEAFAADVREVTDPDKPFMISYGVGSFSRLRSRTFSTESPESLIAKLARIHTVRTVHKGEPNSNFWAYDNSIGNIPAALLYDSALNAQIKKEEEDALEAAQPEAESIGPRKPLRPWSWYPTTVFYED